MRKVRIRRRRTTLLDQHVGSPRIRVSDRLGTTPLHIDATAFAAPESTTSKI
ncbi:hypothetical protein [Streptomyces hokutonensis]|uniref:hypothetical protein n=1 Tax=Streptomyces hokutonensis TaxID=1306990 RepID=UPI00036E623D|nr:hypothetical protein [Streptomyces hokutonensis]